MESQQPDPALRAANLALSGRRTERAASRFASIELRGVAHDPPSDRRSIAWEMAAMASIGAAAVMTVVGIWLL